MHVLRVVCSRVQKRCVNLTAAHLFVESSQGEVVLMFKFEKFVDTDKSFSARVTIRQRTGQFGFNAGAINLHKVRDFKFAVLYFDRESQVVGIGLTNEIETGAIEIKQAASNTYVRAKNFCDKYGIDYSESHAHELKKQEESGLLYIELERKEEPEEEIDSQEGEEETIEQMF
jgi:hypothetical protein